MESTSNFKHFQKKIVIAKVFPKLQTVKYMVRPFSKKRRFRTSFDSQHVKLSQKLVKSAWEHFYHIFPSLSSKMIQKMFPLLKVEIAGVLVNTLAADYKYPSRDCENLPFPIQMQLSKKRKKFSEFFVPFIESTWNFKHFQKKKIVIGNVFPNIQTVKYLVTPL